MDQARLGLVCTSIDALIVLLLQRSWQVEGLMAMSIETC